MRVNTFKQWVAAALLLIMPCVAIPAGLGRLTVLSMLGQPFSAEIDLVNVQKSEMSSLNATIAPPSAYQTANLQFNPALQGMRVTIERRPDGQPFIKLNSTRPVAEPFLDLLIQLTWEGNKIVREYSALLDPPGMETPAPSIAAPVTAPMARPAPATQPPAEAQAPAPAPSARVAAPAATPATSSKPIRGSEYAVKQGDTLGGIAANVKPDGVTLEQTLIGLFRANPEAFINSNINLVRAGKILRVPDREQIGSVAQGEAAREVRVHSTNWNAYRQKLAESAPAAAETAPATSGKITARVEDKGAATGAKDVVVLSKGETAPAAKGKDGKAGADRVRALEEDLAARDKALAEAKDRVSQLEKTIKDMQKLAELKSGGMAAAQQAAKPESAPASKPDAAKPEPAKADAAKPDATAVADKPADKPAVAPVPEPPKAEKAADAPKPKPKPVAPPPPAPGIMDTVMDNIVPIGGGAAILGLAGWWLARRRKPGAADEPEMAAPTFKTEPFTGNMDTAMPAAAAAGAAAEVTSTDMAAASDTVDPIEEAQVYIDHGRDTQAEEILKEAINRDPQREDVQVKLLEVYAARGDKDGFNSVANGYHQLTAGIGDQWTKVAAMGYALDPSNTLYAGAADVEVPDMGADSDARSATVDLDLGTDQMGTTTDIELDAAPEDNLDKTIMISRAGLKPAAAEPEPGLPEFNLDLPPVTPPPAAEPAHSAEAPLDFNLDLPPTSAPAAKAEPAPAKTEDAGLDFKVDFSNIDLKLDDVAPAATAGAKDAHWNDVQQKFDLARAYQDMGDKDGAKEILREVIKEGDAQQQTEAQKLLESIK